MLKLSRNGLAPPARLGGLILAAAASLALSGCGIDLTAAHYASSDPVLPSDYHQRHPIVLARAPTALDIYPTGGGLDAQSVSNIRAFADAYRQYGTGQITVLTPGGEGRHARAVAEIRKTLADSGAGYVAVGGYPSRGGDRVAPIRLVYSGLKSVVASTCGQWTKDIVSGSSLEGWKNQSYDNFGCATQSMLAAQVADPRDLAQARAVDPPDVSMRLRAIESVRKGADPGTAWKTQTTTIGSIGGN